MLVLKRLRPRPGRSGKPSRKAPSRRYYRRNPELLGTPVEDVAALIGGAYATQQVASLASGVAAPITSVIDRVRAGLGQAVLQAVSAVGVGWAARRWRARVGTMAQLGGMVVAGNGVLTSFAPGVNALGGTPALVQGGRLQLIAGGKKDEAKSASAAQSAVASQL